MTDEKEQNQSQDQDQAQDSEAAAEGAGNVSVDEPTDTSLGGTNEFDKVVEEEESRAAEDS